MSTGNHAKTRQGRVSRLELPPGRIERIAILIRRGDVLLRFAMSLGAAVTMWLVTQSWSPPFAYRLGDIPSRNIDARVEFSRPDEERTREEREVARTTIECVYDHDVRKFLDMRAALKDDVLKVLRAESFDALENSVWNQFVPKPAAETTERRGPNEDETNSGDAIPAESEASAVKHKFEQFRQALADDPELKKFGPALERATADIERYGLLFNLEHDQNKGRMTAICVHRISDDTLLRRVPVEDVRIDDIQGTLLERLENEAVLKPIAEELFTWLVPNLLPTLTFNQEATTEAATQAAEDVEPVEFNYQVGHPIIEAGNPLTQDSVELLRLEHLAYNQSLSAAQRTGYGLASFGMYIAIFTLCGCYIYLRRNSLLSVYLRLGRLLLLVVLTVSLSSLVARHWQSELIPMLLFAMTASIVYRHELALLLAAALSLVVVLTLGYQISEFVVLSASLANTILLLRHVRSRTKIIYVGVCTAVVSSLTTVGVGVLTGHSLDLYLITLACWNGFSAILAGVLMTGLLPFVERMFEIQTELSLLELGDVAHPLLQELVRRAPGTYNHSINVASISAAAAEAIGADELLVRVGAYFHDIGKMLKPGYFVENQGEAGNRHDNLVPTMSTLIIIAHVKDGADLARQHNLPQPLVDFVLQHHGTTLVEYFYNRASQQCEDDPNLTEVDEGSYRYPGPKPQSKEAAVLMISDAVEGAARALVDPTPARIESLVHDLAMKRLLDGQFDECDLTLRELRDIQDSLVKSLVAMYHGRVQYPDQQSA